jgi:hypothetical protein
MVETKVFHDLLFFSMFRLSKKSFSCIVSLISNDIQKKVTKFKVPLSPDIRLAIFLYYCAHGTSLRCVGQQFGVAHNTASEILSDVALAIVKNMKSRYLLPNLDKVSFGNPNILAAKFSAIHRIPQCIGCIDGCHIPIKRPSIKGEFYFNRKSFYSFNIQAVCDYKCRFLDVVPQWPGSVGDGRVFRISGIMNKLKNIQETSNICNIVYNEQGSSFSLPVYILGDSGYHNSFNIVTTYDTADCENPDIKRFNKKLSSIRYLIEKSFGILKCRFRVLLKAMELGTQSTHKIPMFVSALCILHNFLIDEGDEFDISTRECEELLYDYKLKYPEDTGGAENDNQSATNCLRNHLFEYYKFSRNL